MRTMIRGIITSVIEGAIKILAASGLAGEDFSDREYFQHYGFTSRPVAGAECILIRQGNHIVAIASDDRRYRISLQAGEVAIYDDQGQWIHMKDNGVMNVNCVSNLVAHAGQSAVVTSPLVHLIASSKVTMDTPLTECNGDLTVAGAASVQGTVSSATAVADPNGTMQAMRNVFGSHTHNENGDGGGVTDPPNQQM